MNASFGVINGSTSASTKPSVGMSGGLRSLRCRAPVVVDRDGSLPPNVGDARREGRETQQGSQCMTAHSQGHNNGSSSVVCGRRAMLAIQGRWQVCFRLLTRFVRSDTASECHVRTAASSTSLSIKPARGLSRAQTVRGET